MIFSFFMNKQYHCTIEKHIKSNKNDSFFFDILHICNFKIQFLICMVSKNVIFHLKYMIYFIKQNF